MGSARIPLPREVSAEHDQAEQDAWYKLTRGPPGFKGALRVQFTMKDVRSSSDGGAPPKPPSAAEGAPAAPFTTTSRRRTSVPTAAYLAHSPEFQQMFGSFGAMREFPKMEEMMFDIPLVKRGGTSVFVYKWRISANWRGLSAFIAVYLEGCQQVRGSSFCREHNHLSVSG